jgi:NitT/TauT family transport system substrate-binding protein
VLIAQIDADVKHTFFSSDTLAHGIGSMNKDTWQKTVKTLVEQGAMKQTIDASKAFAYKYLAAASPVKQ